MSNDIHNTIDQSLARHGQGRSSLLNIFWDIQNKYRCVPNEALKLLSKKIRVPFLDLMEARSFYHLFSEKPRGQYTIYLNDSSTAKLKQYQEVLKVFEFETGASLGGLSTDKKFGLYPTSCIGCSDQEPSALINNQAFTQLTPEKIKDIVSNLRQTPTEKIDETNHPGLKKYFVRPSHLRSTGPVFFTHQFKVGDAIKKAIQHNPLEVINSITRSGLRGRGGAGFPTGKKWSFCRKARGVRKFVIANIDEGEPGTFKDKSIIDQDPRTFLEGMIIAAYATGASEGFIYLRGEYAYLKDKLQKAIEEFYDKNLLGYKILGHAFSLDLHIKLGAGAYICGEESALIESAEGNKGEPRNRPPFPVQQGYLHAPTVVNNPETYYSAARICHESAEWYKSLGSANSSGTKLLSISGDCGKEGIFEVEFGVSIQEVLDKCEAKNTLAVQVGGPSGQLIAKSSFQRSISYEDLSTGGSFIVFDHSRDILKILEQNMEFFERESCGYCVPCRAGNTLLRKTLIKIIDGFGTKNDMINLREWSRLVKQSSRCGLGQSSPNTILSALTEFTKTLNKNVEQEAQFVSQFDLSQALAQAHNLKAQDSEETSRGQDTPKN